MKNREGFKRIIEDFLSSTSQEDQKLIAKLQETISDLNLNKWLGYFLYPLDISLPEHYKFLTKFDKELQNIEKQRNSEHYSSICSLIGFSLNPDTPSSTITETSSIQTLFQSKETLAKSQEALHKEYFCLRIVNIADTNFSSTLMRTILTEKQPVTSSPSSSSTSSLSSSPTSPQLPSRTLCSTSSPIRFSNRRNISDGIEEHTICIEPDAALRALCNVITTSENWCENSKLPVLQQDIPPGLKVAASQSGTNVVRYFRHKLGEKYDSNSATLDTNPGSRKRKVEDNDGEDLRTTSSIEDKKIQEQQIPRNESTIFNILTEKYEQFTKSTETPFHVFNVPEPRVIRRLCCIYNYVFSPKIKQLFKKLFDNYPTVYKDPLKQETDKMIYDDQIILSYAMACIYRKSLFTGEYYTSHANKVNKLSIDLEAFYRFSDSNERMNILLKIQEKMDTFVETVLNKMDKDNEMVQRAEQSALSVVNYIENVNTDIIRKTWRLLEAIPKKIMQLKQDLENTNQFVELEQLCLFFKNRDKTHYACFEFLKDQTCITEIYVSIRMLLKQEAFLAKNYGSCFTIIGSKYLVIHHGLMMSLRDVSYSFVFINCGRVSKQLPIYPAYLLMLFSQRQLPNHVKNAKAIAIRSVIISIASSFSSKRDILQGILEIEDPFSVLYSDLHILISRWTRKKDIVNSIKKAYENISSHETDKSIDSRRGDILWFLLSFIYLRNDHFISVKGIKLIYDVMFSHRECQVMFPHLYKYIAIYYIKYVKTQDNDTSRQKRIKLRIDDDKRSTDLWTDIDQNDRRIMPWIEIYIMCSKPIIENNKVVRSILKSISIDLIPKLHGQIRGLTYHNMLKSRMECYLKSFTRKIDSQHYIAAYRTPDSLLTENISLTPITYLLRIFDWHSLHQVKARINLEDQEGPCEIDPINILRSPPQIPISTTNDGYPIYSDRSIFIASCRPKNDELQSLVDFCIKYYEHARQETMFPLLDEDLKKKQSELEDGELISNNTKTIVCPDPFMIADNIGNNAGLPIDHELIKKQDKQLRFAYALQRWRMKYNIIECPQQYSYTRNWAQQYEPYFFKYDKQRVENVLRKQTKKRETKYQSNRKRIENIHRAIEPEDNNNESAIMNAISQLGQKTDPFSKEAIDKLFIRQEKKYFEMIAFFHLLGIHNLYESSFATKYPLKYILAHVEKNRETLLRKSGYIVKKSEEEIN